MKIGLVVAIDPATGRVRVQFQAQDALVSAWLPVLQQKTARDQAYWLPDLDEQVVCLMDAHEEFGVVIGAIYSARDVPPVASGDKRHVRFADGTTLEYDRAAHRLTANVKGTLEAVVDVSARVVSPLVTLVAVTKIECETPLLNVSGNITAGGMITAAGNIQSTGGEVSDQKASMSAGRTIYNGHTHSAPGGATGPPQQQQ